MDLPSMFQQQFPLSPNKLKKKIYSGLLVNFFISFFLTGVLGSGITAISMLKLNSYSFKILILSFVVIFLVFVVLIFLINLWYQKLYILRYYYDINEQFISIQKGVFSPREIHVQFKKIQDVYVDQDIWDRIFGIYDVHIASATSNSGSAAHIDGVNKEVADYLKNLILNKISGGVDQNYPLNKTVDGSKPSVQNSPISFTEKFSSEYYPIESKWLITAFVQQLLVFLIIYGVIFLSFIGDKRFETSKNGLLEINIIILVFFLLPGLIGPLIRLVIWKKTYYFEFMPDFVLVRSGWIARKERQIPYRTIQDVSLEQTFFERLVGLSHVQIENASQTVNIRSRSFLQLNDLTIVGQPYANGQKIVEFLKKIVSSIQDSSNTGL